MAETDPDMEAPGGFDMDVENLMDEMDGSGSPPKPPSTSNL